jgi:hypothetical protein
VTIQQNASNLLSVNTLGQAQGRILEMYRQREDYRKLYKVCHHDLFVLRQIIRSTFADQQLFMDAVLKTGQGD